MARAGWCWVLFMWALVARGQECRDAASVAGGGPVRVALRGGGVIEGVLEREDDDALHLRLPGQGRMRVPRQRVLRAERLARGAALLQAALVAAEHGRDAEAERLFLRALADPDLELQGRARSQLDAWRERRAAGRVAPTQVAPTQGAPTQGAPTQGAPTQGAGTPRPVRPGSDPARLEVLRRLALAFEPAVRWVEGRIAGPPLPELGLPGQVFALDLRRGQTVGALLVVDGPSAPPGLDLFDQDGKRLLASHVGVTEGTAELVATAQRAGTHYLFAGSLPTQSDERQPYRLLVAEVLDLGAYDTSRRLRPGEREEGLFDPASPELEGRPVRFLSFEQRQGQGARAFSRQEVRLFTGSGIPLPDGRAIYDGHYHLAVLGERRVERGKVEWEVRLELGP